MCGIVGYVGPNVDGRALEVVMEGLARLEYRGYDSAGRGTGDDGDHVDAEKRAGKLTQPRSRALAQTPLPESSTGDRAHRGGPPTAAPPTTNAHPHLRRTTASWP